MTLIKPFEERKVKNSLAERDSGGAKFHRDRNVRRVHFPGFISLSI